jgi:pimeloyl-ACP methyl ester carboxylesterase
MPFIRNCTAAILAVLSAVTLDARQAMATAAGPREGTAEFVVFAAGRQIGREQVTVAKSGGTWIITSTGRHAAPIDMTINRFEVKYASDWQPIELSIDATAGNRPLGLKTSFGLTTAINEITQGTVTNSKTDQVSARTVVVPNGFFGAYEALAARLAGATVGTEIPLYVAPQAEIKATVKGVEAQQLQGNGSAIATTVYELSMQNPGGALMARVAIDSGGRLARVEMAGAGLNIVRSDLASVAVRQQTTRNPTDADAVIPALGFNLAATVTLPTQAAGRLRHPAVILVPGSGRVDREENVFGIPIFTQLAGALAERGYLVVRYDKRGVGQSGGRDERATIEDYADDVLAVRKWLSKRKDVDKRHISVVGHSEGGAVALIAGSREEDIASLVLIAAPGTRGSELILEQQSHALDALNLPDAERAAKVELQKRIQTAVMTGVGLEGLPAEVRKIADTAWFKSLLLFDPAEVMKDVKQPILIIQGELDTQVPPHHAEKLAAMARARKKAVPVEVVLLPGVNHLLVHATSGEVSEYPDLKEKTIVPEVAQKIAEFLAK